MRAASRQDTLKRSIMDRKGDAARHDNISATRQWTPPFGARMTAARILESRAGGIAGPALSRLL